MRCVLEAALDLSTSTKPFDSVTAAHLLNLLLPQPDLSQALLHFARQQDLQFTPASLPPQPSESAIVEVNTLAGKIRRVLLINKCAFGYDCDIIFCLQWFSFCCKRCSWRCLGRSPLCCRQLLPILFMAEPTASLQSCRIWTLSKHRIHKLKYTHSLSFLLSWSEICEHFRPWSNSHLHVY